MKLFIDLSIQTNLQMEDYILRHKIRNTIIGQKCIKEEGYKK